MARRCWLPLIASLALLSACAPAAGPGRFGLDPLHQQAQDALARYDKALADAGGQQQFVPVGELTGQIGTWEAVNGDHKRALMIGSVVADAPVSEAAPPPGTVVWDDGTTMTIPLASAAQTLRQLVAAAGKCGGSACTPTPLHVTAAHLSNMRIQTTRGPATVPAWEYTLMGTEVRVTRGGVASPSTVIVKPPPWDPYNAPEGISIESATTTPDGRQLTVSFTGAPLPASQPCGADYTAEAVESANAVAVIVLARYHAAGETCFAVGAVRTAIVDLTQPLRGRAV